MSPQLEAFIEYISVTKALALTSVSAYQSDLLIIENELNLPLISINTQKLHKYLFSITNKRTLNRKLSALNMFFNFCYKSSFTEDNKKFPLSKISSTLPKFLTNDEIMRGLKLCDKSSWLGLRDYTLILFLYATGLRISECLNVTKSDIEEVWLRVRHGKGDKERLVPIASNVVQIIEQYLTARPFESDYIWSNYKGSQLSRISAYKITQKYLNVSPHVLRHSYATALILGDADLRVVQELLGHSSLLTTQIYTHIQQQHLQKTVLQHHPLSSEKI